MKICATTLGETAGDLLSMTLHLGYLLSSVTLLALFLLTLAAQLASQRYHPAVYWLVIVATSTAGTTMSDFLDRSLGLGYATGAALLSVLLVAILVLWRSVEGTLSVEHVTTRRGELFYWTTILISNTLGTALGDYLADDSGLGFLGGASLIGLLLVALALTYTFTSLSRIGLFWGAFVLTRPFGATAGDLMTKPADHGGFALGTAGSSLVLFATLAVLVAVQHLRGLDRPSAMERDVHPAARI